MSVDDDLDLSIKPGTGWRISETKSFSIILDRDAHRQMLAYAATDLSRELGGVILGSQERRGQEVVVRVKAAIEARDAVGDRASVKFTHKSWEYINEVKERYFSNLKIVGWFHTHPGFGIFLSEYDRFIHNNFFNLPWQVAFVIDPQAKSEGFFRWDNGKLVQVEYKMEQTRFRNGGYALPAKPEAQPVKAEETTPKSADKDVKSRFQTWQVASGLVGLAAVFLVGYWIGTQKPAQLPTSAPPPAVHTQGHKNTEGFQAQIIYRHRVRYGENLWNISKLYYGTGFRYQEIAEYNHIGPDRNIRAGQILEIPHVEEGLNND